MSGYILREGLLEWGRFSGLLFSLFETVPVLWQSEAFFLFFHIDFFPNLNCFYGPFGGFCREGEMLAVRRGGSV